MGLFHKNGYDLYQTAEDANIFNPRRWGGTRFGGGIVGAVEEGYKWKVYNSRYSGGFSLLNTMIIPRPCAYVSANFTQQSELQTYYRGQKTQELNMEQLEVDSFDLNESSFLKTDVSSFYQNGTSADDFAVYNSETKSIQVQTDDEDKVGVQRVVFRDCDALSRLLEVNLYIEVLSNNPPDFVTELETSFTMAVGDVVSYKLPPVVDSEGNDIPEVYIDKMNGAEDKFPPFLMFENATNTITFKPDSQWVQGRTYYYTIVVKESNSDSVLYPYYGVVTITGQQVSVNTTMVCDPNSHNETLRCNDTYETSCDVPCEYSEPILTEWGECYCDEPAFIDDLYDITAKSALRLSAAMAIVLQITTLL